MAILVKKLLPPPRPRPKEPADEVREFDREFIIDGFTPPTKEALSRFIRAKRKSGRPRVGEGVQVISVSVERRLLDRSDTLAKELGLSRAALVARGLKAVLAAEGKL